MHYTYVFLSQQDDRFYTACTHDLKKRVLEHNGGRVRSAAHRRPLELIHDEARLNRDDAFRREPFLESGKGKRFLKNRLTRYRGSVSPNKLERH